MCSYREKKPEPTEMMQLDGFTVDYTEPHPGKYRSSIVNNLLNYLVCHWSKLVTLFCIIIIMLFYHCHQSFSL